MNVLDKVRNTISGYQLILPGELILVAVSGGPDSLALLELLYRLKAEFDFQLHVVHLNHKLRIEADSEAEFVRKFAESHSLPVTLLEYDIAALHSDVGGSMQDQAREIRYRLFNQMAERIGAAKIALGHHADDLAETILMRFIRGAGLEGLIGFTARSRERLIRPLINISRQEIENFCRDAGLTPCYDSSNQKPIYFRNRIRLELIPELEKNYNPKIRHQMVQMSQIFDEENQVLEEYVQEIYQKIILEENAEKISFDVNALSEKKPAIIRRIIRLGMEKLKGDKKNLYYIHYLQMQDLVLHGSPGKMIHLPDNFLLYRGYNKLQLGKVETILNKALQEYTLEIPGEIYLKELDMWLSVELVEGKMLACGEAALDADLLGDRLIIRSRRPGDWFYPLGLKGKKKVKDFLIDQKIDRFLRDLIPIVTTADGNIVWILGQRLDDRYKITSKTKKTCLFRLLRRVE